MPKQSVWENISNEAILAGIAACGSEEAYAATFTVTGRCLRRILSKRGIALRRGRKRATIKPVETQYRGRFPVWFVTEGRYKSGLNSYKSFAEASNLGMNEIKHFFKRRRRQYLEFIEARADPTKIGFVFTSVDGRKFPGLAIESVASMFLDPMSTYLTLFVKLRNGHGAKIRMLMRTYLEDIFGITVPHLVDQVTVGSPSD